MNRDARLSERIGVMWASGVTGRSLRLRIVGCRVAAKKLLLCKHRPTKRRARLRLQLGNAVITIKIKAEFAKDKQVNALKVKVADRLATSR